MIDCIGQLLGNYRLIGLLGQGGFADVYLGEHVHLNTQAAIKVLRTQLTGQNVIDFRNEARTIAHLEHPHIVQVLDFGVEGTTPFLVMVYAPGGTLRQHYPRGSRLPAEQIVLYTNQMASALQYAHQQKFIHRDVKPENMLIGRNQEILLSDFGIALVTQTTRPGSLLEHSGLSEMAGTVPYMAPEQIQGRPSISSDQYALAVVVYEWICGTPPFVGPYMEVALQHVSTFPPLLREKDPTIPADVEKVVLTALAKDPSQRFGSVQAFATALEQAYQSELTHISGSIPHVPPFSTNGLTEKAAPQAALYGTFGHLTLGSAPVKIGRTPSNQLVIDDFKASSQHAEIHLLGQGYQIQDLNSTNGTFVNEQRLVPGSSRSLNQGDRIRIGDTTFSYVQGNAMPPMITNSTTQRADSHGWGSVTPALTPALPLVSNGNVTGGYQAVNQPVILPAVGSTPPAVQTHDFSHVQDTAKLANRTNAPSPPPSRFKRRKMLWIALSLAMVLLVLAGSALGVIAYVNAQPTPAKTMDAFCTSLQNRDYQAAYGDLSNTFKRNVSSSMFQSFFATVSSCTHGTPTQGGPIATANLTTASAGQIMKDTVTLTQGNNTWQINDIANLSAMTKTLTTFCTALQQGDYPTAYSQLTGQMQSKMTEQQMTTFFPKATSCTYNSVALTPTGAALTLTTTTQSATDNDPVTLDSKNNWKIDGFANLPDKTLDTFCTALQNKDYQTAYNELSVAYKGNYPETQFASDYSTITSCTHDSSNVSNGTVLSNVTFTFTGGQTSQYRVSLDRDTTGSWKIDSLVYPPAVPLDNFCTALQNQDYQTAYNQTSAAFQSVYSESQFTKDVTGLTSCTHDFPTMTGTIATATMTLGNSSGQTAKYKVTLIQDQNGDWKIEGFHLLP